MTINRNWLRLKEINILSGFESTFGIQEILMCKIPSKTYLLFLFKKIINNIVLRVNN